jgi:5-hydroxyisourate hydrolase-like protein (transthyretin family)
MHVWPILQVAHVSFSLSHASVKVGKTVVASGKGTPAAAGRVVELQRLEGKKWHNIGATTEKASGAFAFHITEHTAGKYAFRAATDDKAGYVQFGYSSARKLTVHKKKHS